MSQPKIKRIAINGRTWRDKVNGNTYCSASVTIDGEQGPYVEAQYGPGECYIQFATEEMDKAGLLPGFRNHDNGSHEGLFSYCDRMGIETRYNSQEVKRMKQLDWS